ncbi:MAG: hypothetical protein ABEJ28_05250 [Salinigranum sp.]
MRASRMSVECPICHGDVSEAADVREHLLSAHTKRELASYVASELDEPAE